jgi:uncharacterized protein (DUF433 family)
MACRAQPLPAAGSKWYRQLGEFRDKDRASQSNIEARPDACGGQPVVEGTRIPVAALVRAQHLGLDFDEILAQYPTLRPVQLHAAFVYYLDHRAEIDRLIAESETPPPDAKVVSA